MILQDEVYWEKQLEAPIVGAWMLRNGQLSAINLFPPSTAGETDPTHPQLFLGQHMGSPYIHVNRYYSSSPFDLPERIRHPEIGWKPYRLSLSPTIGSRYVFQNHPQVGA
jgi:hypothetical protein